MPFDITLDFSYWGELTSLSNPFIVAWRLIADGGWIVFVILLFVAACWGWLTWRQNIFVRRWNFILLAIDIPKDNEQSPKAVESIFAQLAGTYYKGSLIKRYWKGRKQERFSFEIVSDGGYLQFYIHTLDKFRDLVEAAVYAQYPDAIITQVEDYINEFKKTHFPKHNNDIEVNGTELRFTKNNVYPIRTYPMFEHTLSQEFKDPMAGLLETLSRVKPGEKMWLQLVITPIDPSWTKAADAIVGKITGKKIGGGDRNILDFITDAPVKILGAIYDVIYPESIESQEKSQKDEFMLLRLTPGESDILKAVQEKISKIGLMTTFRIVHLAPKQSFKVKELYGIVGAIQQFSTLNLNALVPSSASTCCVDYFMIKTRMAWRKNMILRRYRSRDNDGTKIILNTEELATLYHFPDMSVKAPLLAKTESKRAEPPVGLPSESMAAISLPSIDGGEITEKVEEEKDEFISLLEEVAVKRDGAAIDNEGMPEELLGENKTSEVSAEVKLEENIIIKKKLSVKDKGGIPSNLPIG